MGSKAFLLLGLMLAIVLLISSDVVARELAETSSNQKHAIINEAEVSTKTNEVDDAKHGVHERYSGNESGGYGGNPGQGGYGGNNGGGYGGNPGQGGYGGNNGGGYGGNPGQGGYGGNPGQGGYGGNNGGGYGGNPGQGGYGGNPGHGGYGGNPGQGGYGGGGHGGGSCYNGCCLEGFFGNSCIRCCSYAGEAVDVDTEAKP